MDCIASVNNNVVGPHTQLGISHHAIPLRGISKEQNGVY